MYKDMKHTYTHINTHPTHTHTHTPRHKDTTTHKDIHRTGKYTQTHVLPQGEKYLVNLVGRKKQRI